MEGELIITNHSICQRVGLAILDTSTELTTQVQTRRSINKSLVPSSSPLFHLGITQPSLPRSSSLCINLRNLTIGQLHSFRLSNQFPPLPSFFLLPTFETSPSSLSPLSTMSSPPSSSSDPTPAPQTNRRRAYLLKSDQPFARSALKRQSVMTLPSIAHLQHGFAKIGLEGKEREKENRSIGGGRMGRTSEGRRSGVQGFEEDSKDSRGEGEEDDEGLILGPEPERPKMSAVLPWEAGELGRSVKDEKELRVQVLVALEEVRRL